MKKQEQDPDWMYKSILNGAFSGKSLKTEQEVIGTQEQADYTLQ